MSVSVKISRLEEKTEERQTDACLSSPASSFLSLSLSLWDRAEVSRRTKISIGRGDVVTGKCRLMLIERSYLRGLSVSMSKHVMVDQPV